ncbi:MAG TPA: ribonucleoside-triphosphate reductase [Bacteroidetes bacterium]|jgi:ribonucleoside-triphosphate reductase (thioredoxin)|nr:ribonucleoside-triphosphate reductase [Bacteroidota bacterium]
MDQYQSFIHKSRYARWIESEGRRETWEETVNRYINFFKEREQLDDESGQEIYEAIHALEVMPSMRCMMTAGEALKRDNVAGFNCSYLHIDHPRAFDELMYVLMCGTGVGFSVERNFIAKLPEVAESFHKTNSVIVVSDSKLGWASAFRELIAMLYAGKIPNWDMGRVRPAGARLKTFGGRASGPDPLNDLFNFCVGVFTKAAGRKLTSIECHDVCCKIADIVVVGGVRRSALISLSNLSDNRMAKAKSGQWWEGEGQRRLANNSVAYTEKPDFEAFLSEMHTLYDSKAGERGIFSRVAAKKIAGRNGRRDAEQDFGTNPCSEIILRSNEFCNLSEVVVREDDDLDDLMRKVRLATIIGTLQSTLTDFRYLRVRWKRNTEEEALLGVSLTGIMDHWLLSKPSADLEKWLTAMKGVAIETNKIWAEKLGVNQSVAITCVKPSGTVSQLVDSASGIHPRFSKHYIRRVRSDRKDPLAIYMDKAGFPVEKDIMNDSTAVFSFPVKSPETSVTVKQVGAMEQLKLWKAYQDFWCEHKPSVTVYYTDSEFLKVAQWIWDNFDTVSGISLLPTSDHIYQQAPYEEIDESQYEKLVAAMPHNVDWENLSQFEEEDNTTGSQELACAGGACEIV